MQFPLPLYYSFALDANYFLSTYHRKPRPVSFS